MNALAAGRVQRIAAALALAGALALLYGPTLHFPLLYDDHIVITRNPAAQSWGAALRAFTHPETLHDPDLAHAVYRPLAVLSLAADRYAWNADPAGHHLTNVLLHAGSSAAAGAVARSLGVAAGAAWLTAALFALHPIQTEVVCWPSSRPEALFAFFFLWAWAGREWWRRRGRPGAAETWGLALFALALLAKEMAITFPLLLALQEARRGRGVPAVRAALRAVLPYAALAVLYFGWRLHVLGGMSRDVLRDLDPWRNLLSMSIVFVRYAGLLLWPAGQNAEHTARLVSSALDPAGLAALAAVAGYGVLAVVAWRRRPEAGLLLAWPMVALLPVSNLIPIWSLMAERYLYLPSVGVFAAVAVVLCGWERVAPGSATAGPPEAGRQADAGCRWRWIRAAVAAACLLACAVATAARVPVWGDELRFWDDVAAKSPTRIKAHNNRGDVLLRRGWIDAAEESFSLALRINPRGPMAHFNLGRVAEARGDWALAEERYRRSLTLNPELLDAWKGVGDLRLRAGDAPGAERAYREFLSRHEDPRVRFNLAAALFSRGALQEAAGEARRVAQERPRMPEPVLLQGHVARRLGRDEEAEALYRQVLELGPSVEAHYNLASMSEGRGRPDEAIAHLEAAAAQAPGERGVWEALARLYAGSGRSEEARRAAGRARALAGREAP